jgi:pheromone shutdown protein TraB
MNNNILIIGTTHLDSSQSIVDKIIEFKPDIIGVELCKTRLNLMVINPMTNQIANQQLEGEGLIDKISKSIKEKSEKENLQYGSDMITASRYALDNHIQLECLDKDILEIKRLMELLPPNEVQGFMTELANFETKTLKEQTQNIDENKVLEELKTKYPVSFEFLVNSRDIYIAFNILKLIHNNPNKRIIVFLGKGHLENIKRLLEL